MTDDIPRLRFLHADIRISLAVPWRDKTAGIVENLIWFRVVVVRDVDRILQLRPRLKRIGAR